MTEVTKELDRAIERIMGVEIGQMGGDNLAVTLCSYFDRDDGSEHDDNGWSQSATDAYDAIKKEIAGLFVPVRAALTTAQAEAEALRKEVEALRAEMARRDANENRNCINWGPCSRHDKRMTDPDEYAPERQQ